jgi:putative inorganic carbon (hco3(-)) transporter
MAWYAPMRRVWLIVKLTAPATRWRSFMASSGGWERVAAALGLALLALFLAGAPLRLVSAGIIVATLLLAVLIQPAAGLAALALAIPFGNLVPLPLPGGVNAVDLLVVLVTATWLAQGAARRSIRLVWPALAWPIVGLVWGLALSLTQATSWRQGLPEWLKWVEFAVLYLVAAQILPVTDPRPVAKAPAADAPAETGRLTAATAWVLAALFLAGLLEVGLGAYQFLRQVGPKPFILLDRFMRAYGTFQQPNPYAGYLGYLAPVAASLALAGLGLWWAQRRMPVAMRRSPWTLWVGLGCGAVALLLMAGIGMSWSRGAWFGLAASLVVVAGLRGRRSAPIVAALMSVLILALVVFGTAWLPQSIATRLSDLDLYSANVDLGRVDVTDANFAVLERLGHWQAGAAMFSDHPWLGVGIGNFAVAYPAYVRAHFYDALGHAHNVYINFLAESGVLGGGAFAIFWLAAFWNAWRASRRTAGYQAALAVGVLGALTYLTIHNIFDNLFVAHMQLQLALLLGSIVALRASPGKRAEVARNQS